MMAMFVAGDKLRIGSEPGKPPLEFTLHADRGEVLYIACGTDRGYVLNGTRHDHYLGFERRLYVFDGKALKQVGT